jgi:hypothetical protein
MEFVGAEITWSSFLELESSDDNCFGHLFD